MPPRRSRPAAPWPPACRPPACCDRPPDRLGDRGGGDETRLHDFNPWFNDRPRLEAGLRRFTVPDGRGGVAQVEGWLLRAAGVRGPQPLLVDVHGGPASHALPTYHTHAHWPVLCARGWTVLALNAVGSSSHGRDFSTRLRSHWGELDLPQHLAAVEALQREGIADDRTAMAGKSYGGHLAAWAIGQVAAFRAAVVMAPVGNLETHHGTSDSGYHADPYDLCGESAINRETSLRLSPMKHVERARTPTLLLQGEKDERCPKCPSEELSVTMMRSTDTPTELVLQPGGDHHLYEKGSPSHRIDVVERVVGWLQRWIDTPVEGGLRPEDSCGPPPGHARRKALPPPVRVAAVRSFADDASTARRRTGMNGGRPAPAGPALTVAVTGASGFLGRRLVQALRGAGHRVVVAGSAPPGHGAGRVLPARFAATSSPADWHDALRGIDVVVNAAGIFRESAEASFDAVHVRGPVALFTACAAQGVRRVVQVSALGADEGAASAYHRSKRAADEALLALAAGSAGALEAVVVQPSLVFGAEGASSGVFLSIAALPVLPLPAGGGQGVQPVHRDDVVAALVALVEAPPGLHAGRRIPLVGPRPLTLAGYLQALRRGLGLPPARTFAVPAWLVGWMARLGDRLPASLLDSASWGMLQRGNTGDATAIRQLLGRPPRDAADFVPAPLAAALRARAQLAGLRGLLRGSLAAVWIATAAVSFGLYPVQDSLSLLERAGVPAALRSAALYGAAALDLAFGVLTLWPLPALSARRLWQAQALLIAGYTLLITLRLPEFWLHPYGPLTKNLPILAVLALLHATETPCPKARR